MKILFNLLVIIIVQNFLLAQTAINVVITGECDFASGNYSYVGLLNGKNNYTFTFNTGFQNETALIGYDNTNWILYNNGDLTDIGFINNTVPAGIMPPLTGWVPVECPSGTLIISGNLSINQNANFTNSVNIFPNPTSNYFTIKNELVAEDNFDYQITDSSGRIIKRGKQIFDEKIDISDLSSGQYFIEIRNITSDKVVKKIIKI